AIEPMCGAAGAGGDTSACLSSASCATGLECVGASGQCRQYCCDPASCDGAHFCDIQPMFDNRDALKVPVCMPVVSCKLLEACDNPNETCAVVGDTGGRTSCV